MANPWFATHAAGFGPLVARLMARDVPGFVPRRGDDSSVLFSADADPRAVQDHFDQSLTNDGLDHSLDIVFARCQVKFHRLLEIPECNESVLCDVL